MTTGADRVEASDQTSAHHRHPMASGPNVLAPSAAGAPTPQFLVDLGFIVFCSVVAALRIAVLMDPPAPSGIDGGNWLAFGHAFLGERIRSTSIVYPPLIPLVMVAVESLTGPAVGAALLGALTSVLPAVGVYLVLRRALVWKAALLAGFLLMAASTGEPTAWGGYPQLVALGALPVALLALDRFARRGGIRRWALAAGSMFVLLAASHLVAVAGAAAAGLVAVMLLAQRQVTARRLIPRLAAVAAPSVVLLPVYLRLWSSVLPSFANREAAAKIEDHQVVDAAELVYREFPVFWRVAVLIAALTPVLFLAQRRQALWRVITALVVTAAALLLGLDEVRFVYLLPTAAILGAGLFLLDLDLTEPNLRRPLAVGAAIVLIPLLAVQTWRGIDLFRAQRGYYAVLSPATVDGLEWLERNTATDALIAVAPIHNWPVGWWVEGLSRRSTLPAGALRWLNFEDERDRANAANLIFQGSFPTLYQLVGARERGVDYLFVPKAWERFRSDQVTRYERLRPGGVAYENEAVVVFRV